jgi:hypothetical protein
MMQFLTFSLLEFRAGQKMDREYIYKSKEKLTRIVS